MRILMTGATGFLGSHLADRLSRDHAITAVVRSTTAVVSGAAATVQADLASLDIAQLPPEIDAVVHTAVSYLPFPQHARESFAVNTASTERLLAYALGAGARQFLLVSSGAVYGPCAGLAAEDTPARPASFYGACKYASELVAEQYRGHLTVGIARPFYFYGPGQKDRLIPALERRIARGEPITVHRNDGPRITPLYIEDTVEAIARMFTRGVEGALNIAGDETLTMRELAMAIGSAIGCEPQIRSLDDEAVDGAAAGALMKLRLGEWPLIPLNEGLRRTLGHQPRQ